MSTAVAGTGATLTAERPARDYRTAEAPARPSGAPVSVSPDRLDRAVLGLVADGCANNEIGRRLGITEPEVRASIGRLMSALDAWSKPALVAAGFSAEWLERSPSRRPARITDRDVVLLRCVAAGWPDSRTADVLGGWAPQVSAAVARLRRLLKARDRAHLVRRSIDAGVLPVGVWVPRIGGATPGIEFETREGSHA